MVPSCPVRRTSYGQKTEKEETRNLTPYGQGTGHPTDILRTRNRTLQTRNRTLQTRNRTLRTSYGQSGHPTDTPGILHLRLCGGFYKTVLQSTVVATIGAHTRLGGSRVVLGQIKFLGLGGTGRVRAYGHSSGHTTDFLRTPYGQGTGHYRQGTGQGT